MSDDLEAFLRRAAQKRQKQQKRRSAEIVLIEPGVGPERAEPAPDRVPLAPLSSQATSMPSSSPADDVLRQLSSADKPQRKGESRQHREAAAAPQSHVTEREPQVELHLGNLMQQDEVGAEEARQPSSADLAREIVQMLQAKGGARRAFVLQEILAPPTHRWEP